MHSALIADDHPIVRAGLRQFLETDPHVRHLAEAASGQEVMNALRDERFDLLILDINMPDRGGLDIHIVPDEQDAITQARQTTYDLMILDLQLRSGTGFGVLEALGDEHPLTVVLTNHALPEYRRRAGELGAEYFLDKSKDIEQLQSIIQRLQMD